MTKDYEQEFDEITSQLIHGDHRTSLDGIETIVQNTPELELYPIQRELLLRGATATLNSEDALVRKTKRQYFRLSRQFEEKYTQYAEEYDTITSRVAEKEIHRYETVREVTKVLEKLGLNEMSTSKMRSYLSIGVTAKRQELGEDSDLEYFGFRSAYCILRHEMEDQNDIHRRIN